MAMVRVFSTTPRIVMGPGSVKTIGTEVKSRGISRVLIVTDKGVISAGLMKSIEESLKASRVKYDVFDKVEPDPRYEIVADCVETARQSKAQMLIGLGGGSPMDITKTAAVMLTNKGPIGAYFGIGLIPKP
ncbi:MAG TPA: iron-containing alcohol dehydrogenase, partial [Desulfomonilia bacterium]|nr:iron-containing alcohol dehydrogenase [Desulfomonilia bacterium]